MNNDDNALVKNVGARIRELRLEKGWTIRDVATRSRLPRFHLIAIEDGKHAATVDTLQLIANALNVTTADLLNHSADDAGVIMELMRLHPERMLSICERVRRLVVN